MRSQFGQLGPACQSLHHTLFALLIGSVLLIAGMSTAIALPPGDGFTLAAQIGPEDAPRYQLTISSEDNTAIYTRFAEKFYQVTVTDILPLHDADLTFLYELVDHSDFFSLPSHYTCDATCEADYLTMSASMNGESHTVQAQNTSVLTLELLILAMNTLLPKERQLPVAIDPPDITITWLGDLHTKVTDIDNWETSTLAALDRWHTAQLNILMTTPEASDYDARLAEITREYETVLHETQRSAEILLDQQLITPLNAVLASPSIRYAPEAELESSIATPVPPLPAPHLDAPDPHIIDLDAILKWQYRPYLQIDLGYSDTNLFRIYPFDDTLSADIDFSDDGFVYMVATGYQFLSFLAAEAGFIQFAKITEDVSDIRGIGQGNDFLNSDLQLYSFYLAAKLILPVHRWGLSFFSKLGIAWTWLDIELDGFVCSEGGELDLSKTEDGVSFLLAFGASYTPERFPNFAINLQWLRLFDVENADVIDDVVVNLDSFDIDAITVALVYQFDLFDLVNGSR